MSGAAFVGLAPIFLSLFLSATPVVTVLLPSPDPDPQLDCDMGPVFVRVGLGGTIVVNGRSVSKHTLRGRLEEIFRTKAERLMFFEADSRLRFGGVLSILEQCKSIPNLTIALVTSSIQKSQCFVLPARLIK
jgi:biopolymer transport protein ExbD